MLSCTANAFGDGGCSDFISIYGCMGLLCLHQLELAEM